MINPCSSDISSKIVSPRMLDSEHHAAESSPMLATRENAQHIHFTPTVVLDVLETSNGTMIMNSVEESGYLGSLDDSLSAPCAVIPKISTESTVGEESTHTAIIFENNHSIDTNSSSNQSAPQTPVTIDTLRVSKPLKNSEPQRIADLRIEVVAFLLNNPESKAEHFDTMSIPQPIDLNDKRPLIAMFEETGLGKHRRFICYVCSKGYSRPERATAHWRGHVNHRPYKCEGLCGKATCVARFPGPESLQTHTYQKKLPKKLCPGCKGEYDRRNFSRHAARCPSAQAQGEGSTSCRNPRQPRSTRGVTKRSLA